jgi:hypothetical protein
MIMESQINQKYYRNQTIKDIVKIVKLLKKPDLIDELLKYKYHIDLSQIQNDDKNKLSLMKVFLTNIKKMSKIQIIEEVVAYRCRIDFFLYDKIMLPSGAQAECKRNASGMQAKG